MLNDVMSCKVNQADIGLFIGFHKTLAQVVDSRKALIVICFRKIGVVEKRMAVFAMALFPVFFKQPCLTQANEELRVGLRDFFIKEALQQVQTPTTTYIATALTTRDARGSSCFRAIEQAAAPGWLLLEMKEFATFVGYRPTN